MITSNILLFIGYLAMTISEIKTTITKNTYGNQYSLCKNQLKFSIITLKRTNIPVPMYILITRNILFFVEYLAMIISDIKITKKKEQLKSVYSLCKYQIKFSILTLKRKNNHVLMYILMSFNILLFIGFLAMIISDMKTTATKINRNQYSLRKNQFNFGKITLKRMNIPVLMLF